MAFRWGPSSSADFGASSSLVVLCPLRFPTRGGGDGSPGESAKFYVRESELFLCVYSERCTVLLAKPFVNAGWFCVVPCSVTPPPPRGDSTHTHTRAQEPHPHLPAFSLCVRVCPLTHDCQCPTSNLGTLRCTHHPPLCWSFFFLLNLRFRSPTLWQAASASGGLVCFSVLFFLSLFFLATLSVFRRTTEGKKAPYKKSLV